MIRREYQGIRYDDPRLQAEFERLLAEVEAAERARAPLKQQFFEAERQRESGNLSGREFEATENRFISANNKIAAAKRKVDQFLGRNKNYRVEKL
jgi:predicted RNase H-like nuclease (RuvC/YqgF family)